MSAPRRYYPPQPRRIAPLAPVGSMLKTFAAPLPQPRKDAADHDPDYLALVRQCPCLHCGMEPCESAHLRMSSAAYGKTSGMGKKPADSWALPLCAEHHRLSKTAQHNQGEAHFWNGLGINPLLCATRLYEQRGDLVAMRAVIFTTIANRSIT